MKLLIAKELEEDNTVQLLEVFKSEYETEVIFFDTSLDNVFINTGAIAVDYEDRGKLPSLSLQESASRSCGAFIFFPKNCDPQPGIIDKLLKPIVEDANITAVYSDHSIDNVVVIKNKPICFCRRIEPDAGDHYDLEKTKGIVKYIPLSLYNVRL